MYAIRSYYENKDYDKEEMKKIGTTELDAKFDSTPEFNTEEYNYVQENRFLNSSQTPLSTFSIDVDTASYSNLRRYLTTGQLPPVDAVRIEEMINYFSYELPEPNGEEPFSISTEIAKCPWNSKHYLAMIGLQAKKINANELPAVITSYSIHYTKLYEVIPFSVNIRHHL